MPQVNGKPLETGCYVDGHWGQYGASRVLRIVDDLLGTTYFNDAVIHGAKCGIMTDELEFSEDVEYISDAAESALNDLTVDGYWHWDDGEFFLSLSTDEEDSE